MKRITCKDISLNYPNFNKPFTIFTDASHHQLGSVTSQDGKPMAFCSHKLNPAQSKCAMTEQESLSIVETLKEHRNVLFGQIMTIYADHKNLTYKNFNTERVMRW